MSESSGSCRSSSRVDVEGGAGDVLR